MYLMNAFKIMKSMFAKDKFASVYINTYLTIIEDSDREVDELKENSKDSNST